MKAIGAHRALTQYHRGLISATLDAARSDGSLAGTSGSDRKFADGPYLHRIELHDRVVVGQTRDYAIRCDPLPVKR